MENKDEVKINNEPSLAQRLEQEKREEERLHMLTSKSGDVPLIHTMESDVYDNIRDNNINKIKILSGQMDASGNTFEADNIIKRRKIMAISLFAILALLLAGGIAYYFVVIRSRNKD
jgi:hypothetical protein